MRFEWLGAEKALRALWIPLALLIAAPWPMMGWPIAERAVPIFFLIAGGLLLCMGRVARASWPLACLILWAGLRAGYHNFQLRSLQVLLLMTMAALLYAAARDLSDGMTRLAAIAAAIGIGYELVLGTLNSFGIYPWMAWVDPLQLGKPMGLLTHPNYWGSFVALGIPILWSVAGIPVVAIAFLLILRTISGGPVISASVGILVMAWPLFSRRVRYAVVTLGVASTAVVMTLHEWRLSGRREIWEVAVPEAWRWKFMGQGLGEWRTWSDQYNGIKGRFFVTLQAHTEPLQLWFELGLIGLVLGALIAWQAYRAARTVWMAAPAGRLPSPWYAWGRAPLERAWPAILAVAAVNMLGSPVFHLPGQAALILLALARCQADAASLTAGAPAEATPPQRAPTRRKR